MKPRLREKLQRLRDDLMCGEFVLADAKDADMAFGVASPGMHYPVPEKSRAQRTMPEFHDQMRQLVRQGAIDILLASASTLSLLAHRERLFDTSDVTPAVRANDTTDIWLPRGGRYRESPSRPFATCRIEEVQYGTNDQYDAAPIVNLGLYSITFNNDVELDLASLDAFHEFRSDALRRHFHYFLEVFAPNVEGAVAPDQVPQFVSDHICRLLAGIPLESRPEFLKIPYFGPAALEELVSYDPTMIVGVLGGSSGTTNDAFTLLHEAKKYGARVALFGRKIKDAEHPLSFVALLRRIADGDLAPAEAVRAYHGELEKLRIRSRRPLEEDLELTANEISYVRK